MSQRKRVVLAFSGGLDTSVILKWLQTDLGYEVLERQITRDELYTADELFFSGTAVEITPIKSVDKIDIGAGTRGEITEKIQSTYLDAVRGKANQYSDWLSKV